LKKLQKLAKLEHADINLKIAAKCGPQKVNDIKIHTPGPELFQTLLKSSKD
jgi:hypothetical protein